MENHPHNNPFSLIADFDGDISVLFRQEIGSTLPILPLRDMMLFPGVVVSVAIGRESSLQLVRSAAKSGGLIGVCCQRESDTESPGIDDLYPVGVAAKVMRLLELPDGTTSAILQGFGRFRLSAALRMRPYMRAYVDALPDELPQEGDEEFAALSENVKEVTARYIQLSDVLGREAQFAVRAISNPVLLTSLVATNMPFGIEEKAGLMEENSVKVRTYKLLTVLNREVEFARLKESIRRRTREDLDRQQKEYFLQQQMRNIQNELGEEANEDVRELSQKFAGLELPEKAREAVEKELAKLGRINPQSPDYTVALNYLQTVASLPWNSTTQDNLSIAHAGRTLDRDHYGMEKVKERILEHLAELKLRKNTQSPILCLYGPPGVGKTSLGRSIADALGRKYVRISLGGVHDEAEIRGHRRTYIGAMPGRIIKSLVKAGSSNPVFILDEIDKVGTGGYNGDPQSALLEVLDPEQNVAFHDNFLDLDFDLSDVFFIATANSLSTIPAPLRDRMEIIEVEGYLTEEKKEIAKRHLVKRAQQDLELGAPVRFSPSALEFLIERYTRESGVRTLEKQIAKVIRKIAYEVALNGASPYAKSTLKPADIEKLLGKPLFSRDAYQGNASAGVVTGLAWTSVGGEILFVETSVSRSKAPRLTLTGNLGDVMKESAMLALEYTKAHCDRLGVDYRVFEQWSLHIHVPEGATPKDGPSAGITIATSIASALTQRKVRRGVAMTGEITLRGKVLPVGGIKEKILAAKRAGITDIVMSEENRKDIEEINERYVAGLTFHFVETVGQVWDYALTDELVENPVEFVVEESADRLTS